MSGKQAKRRRQAQRAAAPPPVRSTSPARIRRASPRVLIGAAAAVLVIAGLGIGLGVGLSGGSSSSLKNVPVRGSLTNALSGAQQVQTLLKGIPQQGNVLGSPKAPVTVVEYIDLQCPFCQAFETQVMPTIVQRYVRTGKVRVEARIISFIGPDSQRGRLAALAAGQQNRLFNFADILYANQSQENTGWLSDSMIANAAASIPGLYVHVLLDNRNTGNVKDEAKRLDAEMKADHVSRTPTVLVGKTGSQPQRVDVSTTDPSSLEAAIKAASS